MPVHTRLSDRCFVGSSRLHEKFADHIGTSLVARTLNRSEVNIPAEREVLIPTFYTGMQCEPSSGSATYLAPAHRMSIFLQPPTIQRSLGCDGGSLPPSSNACPLPESLTGAIQP